MMDLFLIFLFYSTFLTFGDHLLGTSILYLESCVGICNVQGWTSSLGCLLWIDGNWIQKCRKLNWAQKWSLSWWRWSVGLSLYNRHCQSSSQIPSHLLSCFCTSSPASVCFFFYCPQMRFVTDTPLATRAIFIWKGRKPKEILGSLLYPPTFTISQWVTSAGAWQSSPPLHRSYFRVSFRSDSLGDFAWMCTLA